MKHAGERNHVVKRGTNGNTCCYRFRFMLKLAQQLSCTHTHEHGCHRMRQTKQGIKKWKKNICELQVPWIFLCSAQKFLTTFFFSVSPAFSLLITYYHFLSCLHSSFLFFFCFDCLWYCMRCAKVLNTSWDPSPWEMHINNSMATVNTAPNKNG